MTNPNANMRPIAPASSSNTGAIVIPNDNAAPQYDRSNDFVNIEPAAPPPQKTLVYSPDCQIFIARGNKQYDVSKDITAVAVQRNENAISTLVFKLSNKMDKDTGKPRYNQRFERMDRVVCLMKRVKWFQVFSGYLDYVPHVQLYPGTVTFRASCTLKRILHTWWDPGLEASTQIFDQAGLISNEEKNGEFSTDSGLGSLLRRFLVEVGGWNPQNIHIQRFPESYYLFMKDQIQKSQAGLDHNEQEFRRLLLGDDISLGNWASAGRTADVHEGSFTGASGAAMTQPERKQEVIRAVDGMGLGPSVETINASQGLGQAASKGTDKKDKEAWQEGQETARNWENYGKESDAAINCFMCIMAESSWTMYANNAVPDSLNFPHEALSTDHTSVGLFQQTEGNGWGTVKQRMNVRESTEMFLQRLQQHQWRNMDRATAVQAVQGSATSDGSNYRKFEQDAISEVRSLRQNQTPGTGASPGTDPTKVNLPGGENMNTPVAPGAASSVVNSVAGAATASPSPAAAESAAGAKPRFDTQGAINFARAQLGKPYVWGGTGPDGFDCSGLMMAAYASIGMSISHNTHSQLADLDRITVAQAKPGDIAYPNGVEHAVMISDVPGMMIEAQQTGVPIHLVPINFDPNSTPIGHVRGTEWGGADPSAPFNAFPTNPGNPPGTVGNGPDGSVTQVSTKEPIARNLFTYMFIAPPGNAISNLFGGQTGEEEKAFMNDQSMMPTVISMATAGLRKFASAPNGDFMAYYPDYFGMDGKQAVLRLEDIEMKNVQIDLNDDALCTHAYVAGSQALTAGTMGTWGWIMSRGFATVENEWLFRRMTLGAPNVPGEGMQNGKAIMKKFGVRPMVKEMSMLRGGPMEFLAAVQLFMESWAQQYSTNIEICFMPELMPGNRIELVGHNLQVYVSQVTHTGDWENGFSTAVTICAPSTTGLGRLVSGLQTPANQNATSQNDLAGNAATWLY